MWFELQKRLETIMAKDARFGPLHRLHWDTPEQCILQWDDAQLRGKVRSHQAQYLHFMEAIADCLEEYGLCLEAEEDADDKIKNNYLLIVPEIDEDSDTLFPD